LGKKGLTKREMLKNYFLFGSFPQQIEPYHVKKFNRRMK